MSSNTDVQPSLRVLLASCGNIDHWQDPDRSLPGIEDQWAWVTDYAEASRRCRAFIERHDLGGGNWAGGDVLDQSGVKVATISYNGRISVLQSCPTA